MAGLGDLIFGKKEPIPPPESIEAPTPMPDPSGRKATLDARKKQVERARSRTGRKETILSQDDKLGGSS